MEGKRNRLKRKPKVSPVPPSVKLTEPQSGETAGGTAVIIIDEDEEPVAVRVTTVAVSEKKFKSRNRLPLESLPNLPPYQPPPPLPPPHEEHPPPPHHSLPLLPKICPHLLKRKRKSPASPQLPAVLPLKDSNHGPSISEATTLSPTPLTCRKIHSSTPNRALPSPTPKKAVPSSPPNRTLPSPTPKKAVPSSTPNRALPSPTPKKAVPSSPPSRAPPFSGLVPPLPHCSRVHEDLDEFDDVNVHRARNFTDHASRKLISSKADKVRTVGSVSPSTSSSAHNHEGREPGPSESTRKEAGRVQSCPLCQVPFSIALSQLDVDRHVAACLAADDDIVW